ncbi:unnamed protein product, partial [Chrysoparadoxa australica]
MQRSILLLLFTCYRATKLLLLLGHGMPHKASQPALFTCLIPPYLSLLMSRYQTYSVAMHGMGKAKAAASS